MDHSLPRNHLASVSYYCILGILGSNNPLDSNNQNSSFIDILDFSSSSLVNPYPSPYPYPFPFPSPSIITVIFK